MNQFCCSLLAITVFFIGCKNKTSTSSIFSQEPDSIHITKEDSETLKTKAVNDVSDTVISKEKISKYDNDLTKKELDSTKYYIYLTLDDGPQPGTQICRDILKENNVPATFFMIGTHNEGTERHEWVNSINDDPLFALGNHSDTHGFHNKYQIFYNNPKGAFQNFLDAESKINLKHKIARLPGRNTWAINHKLKGESSAFATARKLDSAGYSVFGWDTEWEFTKGSIPTQSADQMVKMVEQKLKSGKTHAPRSIVILAHDRMFHKPQYADSLRKFITTLKKMKTMYLKQY